MSVEKVVPAKCIDPKNQQINAVLKARIGPQRRNGRLGPAVSASTLALRSRDHPYYIQNLNASRRQLPRLR